MSELKEIVPGVKMAVVGVYTIDEGNKVLTLTSGTYIVTDTSWKIKKAKDASPALTIAQQVSDPDKLNRPAPHTHTPSPARVAKTNWS